MTSPPLSIAGPKRLLPHLWQYFRRPMGLYQELAERYGHPFSVPSPYGGRMVVTGCPHDVATMFRAGGSAFGLFDQSAGMVFGETAISALGGDEYLKARRNLLAAPLLRQPMGAADLLRDTALRICERRIGSGAVSMHEVARAVSLDVNIQVIFGPLGETERNEFAEAIHRLRRAIPVSAMLIKALRRDLGGWSPWGRFLRARDRCFALIERRIDAVRAGSTGADGSVLAHCALARDAMGQPVMSKEQIRANLLTLLFAGHDTTAAAVAWGVYWTHHEPGVLAALAEELADYAATRDTAVLKNKPYLDAVCKEILRIYPIAIGSVRRLAQPMTIGNAVVSEGHLVMASMDLSSCDPALFPDPARFRPERFLDRAYKPNEYIPFGGGERRCPGAVIAFDALRVVLATLVCCFDIRVIDRRPVKPVWNNGIRVPSTGVKVVLQRKRLSADALH